MRRRALLRQAWRDAPERDARCGGGRRRYNRLAMTATDQTGDPRRELEEAREEFEAALARHRANERHLAAEIREAQRQLLQARDTIAHMERSWFWRARMVWVRLRRGR
jgi:chromosome segregation ATPase